MLFTQMWVFAPCFSSSHTAVQRWVGRWRLAPSHKFLWKVNCAQSPAPFSWCPECKSLKQSGPHGQFLQVVKTVLLMLNYINSIQNQVIWSCSEWHFICWQEKECGHEMWLSRIPACNSDVALYGKDAKISAWRLKIHLWRYWRADPKHFRAKFFVSHRLCKCLCTSLLPGELETCSSATVIFTAYSLLFHMYHP